MPSTSFESKMGLSKDDLREIRLIISETIETQFKSCMDTLNNRIDKMDDRLTSLESNRSVLTGEVSILLSRIQLLEEQVEDQAQYSRREDLLIHGSPETKAWETNSADIALKIFEEKLDIKLPPEAIQRAHRLGKPITSSLTSDIDKKKCRPIIVRFSSYGVRNTIYSSKKLLARSGLYITEHLTRNRMSLFRKARACVSFKSVWSMDGRIFAVLDKSDVKIAIRSVEDIPACLEAASNMESAST